MEKKIWVKPEISAIAFPANAYCSSCGESGTTYLFDCNGGSGILFIDRDNNGKLTPNYNWNWGDQRYDFDSMDYVWQSWGSGSGSDSSVGSHYSCGEKHEASSEDDFFDGFLIPSGYIGQETDDWGRTQSFISINLRNMAANVKVWYNSVTQRYHATKNLDINSWEIAKS